MERLQSHFIPLDNFRPSGGENFRNTCFIAAVANLRHVLEPVMEYTSAFTWTQFVNHVRAMQDRDTHILKYGTLDGNGQHDAADLLGELLHDRASAESFGVRIKITKQLLGSCDHYQERTQCLATLPLILPQERREYRLSELLEHYETPVEQPSLECDECCRHNADYRSSGTVTNIVQESVGGKMVFRFNRYSELERRDDRIILNPTIVSANGVEFSLEAILQHEGHTCSSGHYIVYLLTNRRWERRDDAHRTITSEEKLRYHPEHA